MIVFKLIFYFIGRSVMKKIAYLLSISVLMCGNIISMEKLEEILKKSDPEADLYGAVVNSYANGRAQTRIKIVDAIKKGAKPNLRDFNPLRYAIGTKDLPLVFFLLQHGAYMNFKDASGLTTQAYIDDLMTFNTQQEKEKFMSAINGFLLQHEIEGSWPDQKNIIKKTLFDALKKKDLEKIRNLLNEWDIFDINPNIQYETGRTPLVYAVLKNNKQLVDLLLRQGANPNIAGKDGITPLMYAVLKSKEELADLLLQHGANLNITDKDGVTPLMYAVLKNNKQLVDFLLQHGANPDIATKVGDTAVSMAASHGYQDIQNLFEQIELSGIRYKEAQTHFAQERAPQKSAARKKEKRACNVPKK